MNTSTNAPTHRGAPGSTPHWTAGRTRLGAVLLAAGMLLGTACSSSPSVVIESADTASAVETAAPAVADSAQESTILAVERPLDLTGTQFSWGRINWTVESAEINNDNSSGEPTDRSVTFEASFIADNTFADEMQYADMVITQPDGLTETVEVATIRPGTERVEVRRIFRLEDLGFERGQGAEAAEFLADSVITLGDERLEQIQIGFDGTVTGASGIVENRIDTTVHRDTDLYTDDKGNITEFAFTRMQVSLDQIPEREYLPGQVGRAQAGERFVAVDATVSIVAENFGENVAKGSVVLVVDGLPYTATSGPNAAMGINDVIEGAWLFIVPPAESSLELQIFQERGQNKGEVTASITLDPAVMTDTVAAPVTASTTVSTDGRIPA